MLVPSGAMNLNISGEWIYYTNGNAVDHIYRMKKARTSPQEINRDSSGNLCIACAWIYYTTVVPTRFKGYWTICEVNGYWKMRLDGRGSQKLV